MTTPSTAMRLFRRRFLGQDGVQEKIPRYRHFPTCPHQSAESGGGATGASTTGFRLGYYGGLDGDPRLRR